MTAALIRSIHTVDSHTEGNATRVIVGGVPVPPGNGLLEKRAWLRANDDGLRRVLNFEPRGSDCMCSVLLLPPESPDAHFSIIIMEQEEYVPMCGHCVIGTATTVVATGMVRPVEPATVVKLDTPAGPVECNVAVRDGKVLEVSLDNVDSFLLYDQAPIDIEGMGVVQTDIAYGGDFYAFIDADALDLDLSPSNSTSIIEVASRVRAAVADQLDVRHPRQPHINACYQVLFTSSRTTNGDYKQVVCLPPGALDRSPCGTGTCAHVAVLHTRGEIGLNDPRRFEGLLGTCFRGEARRAEDSDGLLYVTPRITGRAYLTGFHRFVVEADDPMPAGYRLGRDS